MPTAWHYIPNYQHTFQSTIPFAGVLSPLDIRHPCYSTPSMVLEGYSSLRLFQKDRSDPELNIIKAFAKSDHFMANTDPKLPSVTADTRCWQPIFLLHCTSTFKHAPWAMRLFKFWGTPPPKPYGERAQEAKMIFGLNPKDFD